MWTLVLVAGALLERGRPALDAVRPQAISATVRFLSDDLLEGRGTGTRGHAIAEQYVSAQMQALGLQPAGEGGWSQRVKLCESKAQGALTVDGAEVREVLVAGDWRNHFTPRVKQTFLEHNGDLLIAAGYERDHNW